MKRQFVFLMGVVALLAMSLAAQPASANQSPPDNSAAVAAQASARAQAEVQAALAQAQAEVARAMDEVKVKVNAKVQKELAAKLAAHRGAMLADLQAKHAELAALAQEIKSRVVAEPRIAMAYQDSESGWLGVQIADVDGDKVKELKLPA